MPQNQGNTGEICLGGFFGVLGFFVRGQSGKAGLTNILEEVLAAWNQQETIASVQGGRGNVF